MYIVAREFKADGRLYRPGDPCPEAANWPTLSALLSGGWLERAPVEASTSPGPGAHQDPEDVRSEGEAITPAEEGREAPRGQGGRRRKG